MKFLVEYSFVFGPLVLLLVGILLRYLGGDGKAFKAHHFYFSSEIALSNLGSVLSSLVSFTSKSPFNPDNLIKFIFLAVAGGVVLLLVTSSQRGFEHTNDRPRLKIFVLGFLMNLVAVSALSTTLYFTKYS
jgi:type II secretory pathway component PulF